MQYVVAKPFNTASQRFKPGMDVAPADVGTLDWEHLLERGFVIVKPSPAAAQPQPLPPPLPLPGPLHVDA